MERLFFNGDIITMENESDRPEAMLIRDGIIEYTGSLLRAEELCRENTEKINLMGRCVMPAFIDAHSHISMAARFYSFTDLSECRNFDDIEKVLSKQAENAGEDRIILGNSYDHNFLEEQRHPDKSVLNKISSEIPVFIYHTSGHMGVANDAMLKLAGVDKNTPNPKGGLYGRDDSNELTGYVEETSALYPIFMAAFGRLKADYTEQLLKAQDMYLRNGITTIQDGASGFEDVKKLVMADKQGLLKADIIAYVMAEEYERTIKEFGIIPERRVRIGGAKIILDGSPQGKSAWISRPYEGEKEYSGYPTHTDEYVENEIRKSIEGGYQLLAHCNGDAAAEQYIRAFEKTVQRTNLRPVMIHAQTARKDQLGRMKRIGMIPSFFVSHVFYWGDVHIKNLGLSRAEAISPVKSAMEEGLIYNFHQDTPVVKPDMLHTVWCAVNRITRNGRLLGSNERISVYEALKGVTINAAYEYFEEGQKGSLKSGKKADLVFLDKNPFKVDKMEIKDIRVIGTLKEGKGI